MKKSFAALTAITLLLVASPVMAAEKGNYQIVKTEDGNIWRMDTRTGEIVMCHAESGRMVCASSGEKVATSKATAEDLEAARVKARRENNEAQAEMLDRMMGMFERMMEMVQKYEPQKPAEDGQ